MAHTLSEPRQLFLYADSTSLAALEQELPRVLLIGGYLGYPNFGDILQLKGVIAWHRRCTGLAPVVICDLHAVTDPEFSDRLRAWLGVDAVLYLSDEATDASQAGLHEVGVARRIQHLHLYGGGFLNQRWGPRILGFVELLHKRFGVGHYVMSGQQAEEAIAARLQQHIEHCRPVLAGGRDSATVGILREAGLEADFSFDDAAEAIAALAAVVDERGLLGVPGADVGSARSPLLLHLNASVYASQEADAVHQLGVRLADLLERAGNDARGRPRPVVLLNAYNDARVSAVVDTLGVVQRLDDRFPVAAGALVQLGRLSYELDPLLGVAGESGGGHGARVRTGAGGCPLAFVCSYHAAMLCMMLGIPVWLEARNGYYEQKRAGLGLCAGELEEFLADPRPAPLDEHLAGRQAWLDRAAAVYTSHQAVSVDPEPAPPRTTPRRLWFPKGPVAPWTRESADRERPQSRRQRERQPQAAPPPQAAGDDVGARLAHLEEAKAWLESQVESFRHDAADRAEQIRELKEWADQLQSGKAWLVEHAESWKRHAGVLQERISVLEAVIKQDASAKEWLESQRTAWEQTARQRGQDLDKLRAWAEQLETGKKWLAGERESWMKAAAEKEKIIGDLKAWIAQLEAARSDPKAAVTVPASPNGANHATRS